MQLSKHALLGSTVWVFRGQGSLLSLTEHCSPGNLSLIPYEHIMCVCMSVGLASSVYIMPSTIGSHPGGGQQASSSAAAADTLLLFRTFTYTSGFVAATSALCPCCKVQCHLSEHRDAVAAA